MSVHTETEITSVMDLECWEQGPPPGTLETALYCRLQRQLPFPHGVILPQADLSAEDFAALDQAHQHQITTKCPSGQLLDGLIMLVRSLVACGLDGSDKDDVGDTRLYDVAAHRWGHRRFNDYAMKGHLFAILRDTAGGDENYNPSMHDLLRHPLVLQSIWGHPLMAFFQQSTSFKDPDTGEWEPALPDFLSDAEQAVRLPFRPSAEVDLEAYFAAKMGTIAHDGRNYVLASAFPQVIPIIMRGTRPFNNVRTFDIEGIRWEPGTEPNTKRLNPTYFARYVVAMVLNLDNGDARHYHESTRAIAEHLTTAPGEGERHKHARAESNARWNFEAPGSSEVEFLFLYCRLTEGGGETGVRPGLWTGAVFNPVLTIGGEYEDPRTVGTLHRLNPEQGVIPNNPMLAYAMRNGSQAPGSPWGSMVTDISERSR